MHQLIRGIRRGGGTVEIIIITLKIVSQLELTSSTVLSVVVAGQERRVVQVNSTLPLFLKLKPHLNPTYSDQMDLPTTPLNVSNVLNVKANATKLGYFF